MYRAKSKNGGVLERPFLSDLCRTPPLSAEEERDLAEANARGDREARGRMIQANLRLVVKIAGEYLGRGMLLEDLIGEGNLGLVRAADGFDPGFGTRFSTFASYCIKHSMRDALRRMKNTIRVPGHVSKLLARWHEADRFLREERGVAPGFDEVAAHLGLTERQKGMVAQAQRADQVKLEGSLGDGDAAWSLDQSIDPHPGPDDGLESQEDRNCLAFWMRSLDEREMKILESRYGLDGEPPSKLKDIGLKLGFTKEWVRVLEKRAISKLGTRLERDQPLRADRAHRSPAGGDCPDTHLAAVPAGPEMLAVAASGS